MDFKAWGGEVHGERGTIAAPTAFRRQLWALVMRLVLLGVSSRSCLERVLGLFCACFIFRRELLALFHHSYAWCRGMPPVGWHRLPHFVLSSAAQGAICRSRCGR